MFLTYIPQVLWDMYAETLEEVCVTELNIVNIIIQTTYFSEVIYLILKKTWKKCVRQLNRNKTFEQHKPSKTSAGIVLECAICLFLKRKAIAKNKIKNTNHKSNGNCRSCDHESK